jgi:glycerate-2-kinase
MGSKKIAQQIFMASVESVLPDKIIRQKVFIRNSTLFISTLQFSIASIDRIFVIGAGKASALMAREIENILGDRISGGHIVTKYGHACELKHIDISEAGHPMPDENGCIATQKILDIAHDAKENDLILCLISGGGSALMTDLPKGITLNHIVLTNDMLLKSGADIKEMNSVRKHLSKVKGGQLSQTAYPATIVSLILSDVLGDPADVIASGPTAPDTTTFQDALNVLQKYNLLSEIPGSVKNYLTAGEHETPKPGNPVFSKTHNIIIGNNTLALEAANKKATEFGMRSLIITSELEGQTFLATDQIINTALEFQKDPLIKKPCCLLYGGETTLQVKGSGTGGRNQHLALHAALMLKHQKGITLLSAGTDGTDGPTSATGAIVDTLTFEQACTSGINAEYYLSNFDSHHFFQKAGGLVITGPTMTNVMDIIVVIVE